MLDSYGRSLKTLPKMMEAKHLSKNISLSSYNSNESSQIMTNIAIWIKSHKKKIVVVLVIILIWIYSLI